MFERPGKGIAVTFISIILISLGLASTTQKSMTITGFLAYQAAGYSELMMGLHILLTFVAFMLAMVAAYFTIKSTKRLTSGHFKKHVQWTSMGKMSLVFFLVGFFVLEIVVFYYSIDRFIVEAVDVFSQLALIAAIVFFIKASLTLDEFSKAVGFAHKKK